MFFKKIAETKNKILETIKIKSSDEQKIDKLSVIQISILFYRVLSRRIKSLFDKRFSFYSGVSLWISQKFITLNSSHPAVGTELINFGRKINLLSKVTKNYFQFLKSKLIPPKVQQKVAEIRSSENFKRFSIAFSVLIILTFGILGRNHLQFAISATFGWVQNSWSGGADTVNFATHDERSSWNKYYSKDFGIELIGDDLKLVQTNYDWSETSSTQFASGTVSNTYVSSTGHLVALAKKLNATCAFNAECASNNCFSGTCQENPCGTESSVSYAGQTYLLVGIGNQCWFKQNLNVGTKLASISTVPSINTSTEKWCYGNADTDCNNYGGLYTWAEALQMDSVCNVINCVFSGNRQGVCPDGWHIPSEDEVKALEMSLGMTQFDADTLGWRGTGTGTKLKVGGLSGFDMLFGGYIGYSVSLNQNSNGFLWSSSSSSANSAFMRTVASDEARVYKGGYDKIFGLSVRCIKNSGLSIGTSCSQHSQCASGLCQGGYCLNPTGNSCAQNSQCASGLCDSGYCRVASGGTCTQNTDCVINSGHICFSGKCTHKAAIVVSGIYVRGYTNTSYNGQTFNIYNNGAFGSILNWTASENSSWLTGMSPISGSVAKGASSTVYINFSGLSYGDYSTTITISDPNAVSTTYPMSVVYQTRYPNGIGCSDDSQCYSYACYGSCHDGMLPNGSGCNSNNDCASSYCAGSTCASDPGSGSCPYVFAWNGSEYTYRTDVSGFALNLENRFVTKNYIGTYMNMGDLPVKDNKYLFKFRDVEEEIEFIDDAYLLLVDHADDIEIAVQGGGASSFATSTGVHKIFTLKNARTPNKVIDSLGVDVTEALQNIDNNALPKAHVYDEFISDDYFDLDFGRIEHPENAKLVIDSWRYVAKNHELLRHLGLKQKGNWIEVKDTNGNWVKVKEFTAGSADLKQNTVDISNIFLSDDHTIRFHSGTHTQSFRADRIRLDDSASEPIEITKVYPDYADLHWAGISNFGLTSLNARQYSDDAKLNPLKTNFYGNFTRYGDVLPLLLAVDNKYVIAKTGDELSIEFPYQPLKGNKRTVILESFSSEKNDRREIHPELANDTPDPLPFVGMTEYPYEFEEQSYPYDEEHVKYLMEYNTRYCEAGKFECETRSPKIPGQSGDVQIQNVWGFGKVE